MSNLDKYHPDHDPDSVVVGKATVPYTLIKNVGLYRLPGCKSTQSRELAFKMATEMNKIMGGKRS